MLALWASLFTYESLLLRSIDEDLFHNEGVTATQSITSLLSQWQQVRILLHCLLTKVHSH